MRTWPVFQPAWRAGRKISTQPVTRPVSISVAQCVSWFIQTKPDVQTQRRYRTKYGIDPPPRSSILRWHKKFMEAGSMLDAVRSGRPRISAENIASVRKAFSRSTTKSIRTAARELELPLTTVHKVLCKSLRLYAYKVQMQGCHRNCKIKFQDFPGLFWMIFQDFSRTVQGFFTGFKI